MICVLLLILLILITLSISCFTFYRYKGENFDSVSNFKLTAIILNHSRPHNIPILVKTLEKYDIVSEIIILNGKPDTRVNITSDKIKSFDDFKNNELYGGGRRFLYKNYNSDCVLFIDDDILPSNDLINNMMKEIKKGSVLVGPTGRICDKNGYIPNETDYDSILTNICIIPYHVVKGYQNEFDKNYKFFLEKTHGNGEDLSMNHYIRKVLNKKPVLVKGKLTILDSKNGYSSDKSHYIVRDLICRMLFK